MAAPSTAFHVAFQRLLRAFRRHQDVDRDPENFPEIGDVRAELEDARTEVAAVRPRSTRHTSDDDVVKVDISEADHGRVRAQIFPQN